MFVRLRRYFISGLVVSLPLLMSFYLLIFLINFADGLFGKFIEPYVLQKFGFYFKGLSILIGLACVMAVGFLATNFIGRRIHGVFEKWVTKLPFFRQVYPALKEIAVFLFSRDRLAFKQVVIVEYPRKGIYSFGFLTNESAQKIREMTRQELCNVFVPSAPGPVTGFIIMVPRKDLIFSNIPVEEAIKFNVSGGVVNPVW